MTIEVQDEALVPDVNVEDPPVDARLIGGRGGDISILPLSERAEQPDVVEQGPVDEPADGERLSLSQPDHLPGRLLRGSGARPSQDGDHDYGEPRERCHSLSHDSPLV